MPGTTTGPFQSFERNGIHVITCPAVIESGSSLETAVRDWLGVACDVHVLDFKNVTTVKPAAYRAFVKLSQGLRAERKNIFCLNVSHKIRMQFKEDGLTSVFVAATSVEEIKRLLSQTKGPVIDSDFFRVFIEATKTVLQLKARVSVKPGKPRLRAIDESTPEALDLSMAARFGGGVSGGLCLRLSSATLEKIGRDAEAFEESASEWLAALLNHAKNTLAAEKQLLLSPEGKARGGGLDAELARNALVVPFESPAGIFQLEIAVDSSNQPLSKGA